MNLQGKTAMVTGGAVRIGRAICEALADAGCNVIVHHRNSVAHARQLAGDLRRRGVKAWVVCGSLETEYGCVRLMARAWAVAGKLDILVNNAAVFHRDALRACTARKLRDELSVNLFAPILLTRNFVAKAKAGRIVNLLDRRIAAHEPGCLPYLLSKKALAAFTANAALELAPAFTVNGVAPGAVLPPPGRGGKYLRDRAGRIPLARKTEPSDVAAAVVALLTLDGVTGQIVFADGGQHLLGNGV
jgi:pteridine reductase